MAAEESVIVYNKCCCCLSLRRGSQAIAAVSLCLGVVGTIYSIYVGVAGTKAGYYNIAPQATTALMAVVLLHAVKKERRWLVLAWAYTTLGVLAVGVVLGVVIIFLKVSLLLALILLMTSVLQLYFVIVVRSYGLSITANAGLLDVRSVEA
ncbi:uncharacterized protein LOC125026770 [Penaeus chinensis]|uniref:uncharacterized protein LOC125026770 n=1 Tax=Penaeus chinensis TaxID=139456 RepID=UPI001FB81EE5|nr:uncharacterized protein LOC125026770 [Penaeus chinensis]